MMRFGHFYSGESQYGKVVTVRFENRTYWEGSIEAYGFQVYFTTYSRFLLSPKLLRVYLPDPQQMCHQYFGLSPPRSVLYHKPGR